MLIYLMNNKWLFLDQLQKILVFILNLGKIVVSTNLAESSVTIDNIVFVVDSCFVKVKNYDI